MVNALFNLINRKIEGTGVNFNYKLDPGRHPAKAARLLLRPVATPDPRRADNCVHVAGHIPPFFFFF